MSALVPSFPRRQATSLEMSYRADLSRNRLCRHVALAHMLVACERAYHLARCRLRAAQEVSENRSLGEGRAARKLTAFVRLDRLEHATDALSSRHLRLTRLVSRSHELTYGTRCPCGRLAGSLACARAHPWTGGAA